MDVKVSRKETRWQPDGPVEVLVDNIFDLYPVFGNDPNLVTDIEVLDDAKKELLDRAMFALVKQRGQDPVDLQSGIQWSEAVIGEVSTPAILQQVHVSVSEEGPGVRVVPSAVRDHLFFEVKLTNAV